MTELSTNAATAWVSRTNEPRATVAVPGTGYVRSLLTWLATDRMPLSRGPRAARSTHERAASTLKDARL